MKRNVLLKHLKENGCTLDREGGNHSIFVNVKTKAWSPVPRHTEIKDAMCNEICKKLGIAKIK